MFFKFKLISFDIELIRILLEYDSVESNTLVGETTSTVVSFNNEPSLYSSFLIKLSTKHCQFLVNSLFKFKLASTNELLILILIISSVI